MNVNLNDYITFVGSPINIEWTYGDCATLSLVPLGTEPVLTDLDLGTIDPEGGTAGTYTYSVSYTDDDMTNPSGCHNYCVEIQVTIFNNVSVLWSDADDGWVQISGGDHDGERYYHICCFNGTYGAGNDPGDLTFLFEVTPGTPVAGTYDRGATVDGIYIYHPAVTPFGIGFGGASVPMNSTHMDSIKAAGSNVGVDIAEFSLVVDVMLNDDFDEDTDPLNDSSCIASDMIHAVIGPCITETTEVFDCAEVADITDFDLYAYIVGVGNTPPDSSLTGGVGNQTTTTGPGLGGSHMWELTNVDAELYAAITEEVGAVVKIGPDTIQVTNPPTTSTILSLDLSALTEGAHTFDLQHIVTFNETNYQCFSAGVAFDINTTECCSVNVDSAGPITFCN